MISYRPYIKICVVNAQKFNEKNFRCKSLMDIFTVFSLNCPPKFPQNDYSKRKLVINEQQHM